MRELDDYRQSLVFRDRGWTVRAAIALADAVSDPTRATVDWAATLPGAELYNFDENDGPTLVRFLFGDGRGRLLIHECDDGYCVTLEYDTGDSIQLGEKTRGSLAALLLGLGGGK